ncbi:hypothetical protein FJV46_05485 [Arthrobacter agilis]|uniref:hypothetical protein n=1 Tax=Arthrobacter agilis TaxID=37921 RepID=UPI000B34EA4D|nr:hypothetical protein [Arthrobacter agilis]OUM42332.1 hypothetical protein B8W74_09580 [Arthrobacter agilis]PPB45674.1 hypothetical protein CI784_11580 [Arthrobacter agilis]TPV26344.1 hypothetical protein FJV46_05485 [Arthrobacter agilis]VDR30791.1 Uncharacterised protein [Arthrobacter agilis]
MDTYPSGEPDVQDWSGVVRGEPITLRHPAGTQLCGILDMRTEDASVLWIQLYDGGGRRLVHHADGFRLHRG